MALFQPSPRTSSVDPKAVRHGSAPSLFASPKLESQRGVTPAVELLAHRQKLEAETKLESPVLIGMAKVSLMPGPENPHVADNGTNPAHSRSEANSPFVGFGLNLSRP